MPEDVPTAALSVHDVTFRYGDRQALAGVSFEVAAGQIYGLLGPNGSGKSTLFKLLSTIVPLQGGAVHVLGHDLAADPASVRTGIGVVFQHPALDKQLTVEENLTFHARLYGLGGKETSARIGALLDRFGLDDRRRELVNRLSGGMRRKVELAKAVLTRPRLLLLDEPSTGLDVAARIELWRLLKEMQAGGMTVLLTTHLMDEADRCDRLAILDEGRLLADASPDLLKDAVGGDVISFNGPDPDTLAAAVQAKLNVAVQRVDDVLRIERPQAHLFVPHLIEAAPGLIDSVTVGRPTLDDVFVRLTGRRFHRPGI